MLQDAMRRLSITELWKRRGWVGNPAKSCKFPNEPEQKKASCSIFTATSGRHAGIQLLKDHKRGLTWDAPGLLAEVEGMNIKDACRLFLDLAGVKSLDAPANDRKRTKRECVPKAMPAAKHEPAPIPPNFDHSILNPQRLDGDEIDAIATTRGVSVRSIESLMRCGVLHRVTLTADLRLPIPKEARPLAAWALHSLDWTSFRVRPFAGNFPGFDGQKHKSLTPAGATCTLPIWIGPQEAERVLIVEGEGDAIGAFEIIRREKPAAGLAVVCIFSSSLAIPIPYLPRFEGKRVRIAPHFGDGKRQGEIAAVKWAASIKPFAACVQIFSLARIVNQQGKPIGDLGDLATCSDDTLHGLKGVTSW